MALLPRLPARSITGEMKMDIATIVTLVLEILALVGGSAVISAVLPPKVKQAVPVIGSVIEVLAANVLNAKNLDEK